MMIDLVQLRTFVAVAEERHLTRAAERIHISQSAASTHIRAVEESLGAQLFVRTNRNLELTNAGQLLLRKAKTLLNEAAQFTSFSRELRGKIDGTLIVGGNGEPLTSRLGQMVAALRKENPLVTVDLRALPSAAALQGLKTGELDVGVIVGAPANRGFTLHELTKVRFRVAGPVAWKEQIERADWVELAGMPWIAPAVSSLAYSSPLAQAFADKGLDLNVVVRVDNPTLTQAMVSADIGLILLREERALEGERDGSLAISPIAHLEFPLLIAYLSSRASDPLISAFMKAVAAAWPELQLSFS